MPTGTAPTSAPARPPSPATSRSLASLPPCPQPRSNARGKRTSQSSARACPQLRDRSAMWAVGGRVAEEQPTDAPLHPAGRPVGADQGPAARPRGVRRGDGEGQPPVRRGGALPLPPRHPLARPAGAVRGLEERPPPLLSLGQGRRVGEDLPAPRR